MIDHISCTRISKKLTVVFHVLTIYPDTYIPTYEISAPPFDEIKLPLRLESFIA